MDISDIKCEGTLLQFCHDVPMTDDYFCHNCEIFKKQLHVGDCRNDDTLNNILKYNRKAKLEKLLS